MDPVRQKAIRPIYLVFFLFGVSYTILNPLLPWISDYLDIGYDKIGLALFVGAIFGIISTTIAGRLCDIWNIKKIITIGLILITLGFLLFGFYLTFITMIIAFSFLRFGYGAIDSSGYAYASWIFEGKHSSVFIRLGLLWNIGSIMGPLIIGGLMFFKINPKFAFFFFSVIFLITIFLFSKKGLSSGSTKSEKHNYVEQKKLDPSSRFFLKDPLIITAALMLFFFFGAVSGLSYWLTTYFLAFNLTIYQGSLILSLYWVFLALGLFLIQKIIRKTNEITIILMGNLLGTICILVFGLVEIIPIKIVLLILNALFIAGIGALTFSISVSQSIDRPGTIIGFLTASSYLSGIVFQPVIGYFAEYIGKESIIYIVFTGFIINLVLNFIFYRFLKKKYKNKIILFTNTRLYI